MKTSADDSVLQREGTIEGFDRPLPLLYLLNGGEDAAKRLRAKGQA